MSNFELICCIDIHIRMKGRYVESVLVALAKVIQLVRCLGMNDNHQCSFQMMKISEGFILNEITREITNY